MNLRTKSVGIALTLVLATARLGLASEQDTSSAAPLAQREAGKLPLALGSVATDLVYTPVTPCRVFDSRPAAGGPGPIAANSQWNVFVAGTAGFPAQGGAAGGCGVPAGATSAIINFVTVLPAGPGNIRAWAVADPQPAAPLAAVMNYGSVVGLPAIANGVAVPLCNPAATSCALGDLRLQADTNSTNILGDVVGYFGPAVGKAPPCFDVTNRYVDCGNGTVTDTVTGLVWLKNANCFGIQDYKVANESAWALAHGQCGLTDGSSAGDWRLPTKSEWEATVARANVLNCTNPALTNAGGWGCAAAFGSPFTGVDNFYFTSSAVDNNPSDAWCVTLATGVVSPFCLKNAMATTIFVWPVRGGR